MLRIAFPCAVWLLLAAQSAAAILPQVPWPCLAYDQRCPCLPAQHSCCDDCRSPAPVAPVQCACQRDRAPTALASNKTSTRTQPDQPAIAVVQVVCRDDHARASEWASLQSRRGDVPDIPIRILFCTWLE